MRLYSSYGLLGDSVEHGVRGVQRVIPQTRLPGRWVRVEHPWGSGAVFLLHRSTQICCFLSMRDVKHLAKFKPKVGSKLRPTIGSDCLGNTKMLNVRKGWGFCTCCHGRIRKWNSFHPFGCAINDSKTIIKTVTVLQRSHQINIEVRKTLVWDGDGLGGQAGVAGGSCPTGRPGTCGSRRWCHWTIRATQTWMKYSVRQ